MKNLLLFVLAATIFTGCSKKAEVGTKENPYNIIWYSIGDQPKDLPEVLKKVNEYTKDKIGVTVELKMFGYGEFNQKMQLIQASGESYDLCFTCSWANDYKMGVSKGYYLPLNDLLQKEGQGILKILNPVFLEGSKIKDKNYAIPTNKEIASQEVFRFNKPLTDKYSLDLNKVNSIYDLPPLLKVIHKNEPRIMPYSYVPQSYLIQDVEIILYPIPGAVISSAHNFKVVSQYDNKDYIKMMNEYHKFYKLGYIDQSVVQKLGMSSNINVIKDTAFCDVGGYQPGADAAWSREAGFPVVSRPTMPPLITTNSVTGAMTAISATSERPDLAMKFLNLLNTDPYLRNLIGYGIEGIHYKKTNTNSIEFLPESKNYNMAQYPLGNLFITYLLPGDSTDKWLEFKKWNASAEKSSILGFSFDPTPVKTEIAAIQSAYDQYGKGLHSGAYDPKIYLPKMIEKMKSAGMDKVMAEMQKQLDEWREKKSD